MSQATHLGIIQTEEPLEVCLQVWVTANHRLKCDREYDAD